MKECLVIDDADFDRNMICKIMQSLGFETVSFESALDGLDYCKESMPDIILLDWNMPVMDGIDFLHQLRKLEHGAETTILMCTSEESPEKINKAILNSANSYIVKPFYINTVRQKLWEIGAL